MCEHAIDKFVCACDAGGHIRMQTDLACYTIITCTCIFLLQEAHIKSWVLVHKHTDDYYKCFKARSSADLDERLPGELESWLDEVWAASAEGVRRKNQEHIFMWCRLETLGIMSAIQRDWLLSFVTKNALGAQTHVHGDLHQHEPVRAGQT